MPRAGGQAVEVKTGALLSFTKDLRSQIILVETHQGQTVTQVPSRGVKSISDAA